MSVSNQIFIIFSNHIETTKFSASSLNAERYLLLELAQKAVR